MKRKSVRTKQMKWHCRLLRRCVGESGATFMEYAMLAGLIAIGVAVGVSLFGDKLRALLAGAGDKTGKVTEGVKNADIHMPGANEKK